MYEHRSNVQLDPEQNAPDRARMLCISWDFEDRGSKAPFNSVMRHDDGPPTARKPGLSAPQAAQTLGVSLSTIYRWSDLGYLEFHRTPSGQRRFPRERIDAFIRRLEGQRRDPLRNRRTG
jgi:excisionase family DNA binding protein